MLYLDFGFEKIVLNSSYFQLSEARIDFMITNIAYSVSISSNGRKDYDVIRDFPVICFDLFRLEFNVFSHYSTVFALIIGSGFGITAGAHRLWSHKAYKATWQLRLLLTFLFTISGQVRFNP